MTLSKADQQVLDGSAWEAFCDALKEAGKIIQSDKAPKDPMNQAEGYRYLTRLLRGGLEGALEFRDPMFPQLRCGAHDTIKLGADNPDNRYESAVLDPQYDYRITGIRGTVDYLSFDTVINKYGSGGGMRSTGFLDARDIDISADGRFEIFISQKQQPRNWLPMGPETNSVTVRQTFKDRISEKRAELTIERIGAESERPEPLTAEHLVRGLQSAVRFVTGSARLFEEWAESFLPANNTLPPADQAYCQAIGGDPNIFYFHSAWSLADDEVLVIEATEVPECQTWNFQLDNWWMESLDYRFHRIHVNKHTAKYEDDGGVRIVVSHTDPGVPNWVETAGHEMGTMCWRWIDAEHHPGLVTRIEKLADFRREAGSE